MLEAVANPRRREILRLVWDRERSAGEIAISPHLFRKMAYDPLRDLQPVTLGTKVPNVLTVHPAVAARSAAELIALAKTKPGKLSYGSSGVGNLQHLNGDFQAAGVYCEAKLANQLFNVELNRRISGKGIVSQALVPGPVKTNFANHGDENMRSYMAVADGLTPEEVAKTVVWMATAPETGVDGGRMFYTALGHTEATYTDPVFLGHLKGGMEIAAGVIAACSVRSIPTSRAWSRSNSLNFSL